MDLIRLEDLPSPFYRGSVKAVILDEQGRLLIGRGEEGDLWEMPGGGWEHGESLADCLRREVREELGAEVARIGEILAVYRGRSQRGWMILRVAVRVELKDYDFKYGDINEVSWVTREQLAQTDFEAEEGTVKTIAGKIWPAGNNG